MLSLALMLATACDSNDSVTPGGPTGPTIPSIGGTYTSSSMWRFEQVRASDGVSTVLTCAGGLTIASQLADSFSGTFFVQDATCGTAAGSVTSGTLRTDGAITFALTSAGTDPNFLTAAFGCTYVSGDTVMTGTISGTTLQAQSNTVMDCPLDGGRLTLNVRVSGTK
jgi:hypothetical protein